MRDSIYLTCAIGIILLLGQSTGSSAYAKTIEAGDSSSSWNGTGEFLELGNGD